MSDELKALQETALQARAKADELKAALNDQSSDEDWKAAEQAETDATTAESAFADAQAKADADAAGAQPDDAAKVDEVSDASRTGYAEKGLRAGDKCICPDGRTGTVHSFDAGMICIPNQDQG
jgi:hypothetical protein